MSETEFLQNVQAQETVRTPHGEVLVRPASPADEAGLREMFVRLSPPSIYYRFHMPLPSVPQWLLDHLVSASGNNRETLVAVAGDRIVGHAMYVPSGSERKAEMAVVVEDAWQNRGIGKLLLRELAARAWCAGIEVFTGEALGENRRILGLTAAVFAGASHKTEGGVFHLRMPLRASVPEDAFQQPDLRAA